MLRILLLLCLLAGAACAPSPNGGAAASPSQPTAVQPAPWPTPWPEQEKAKTYVLIHIWYKNGAESCPSVENPARYWTAWIWAPKADDPCVTIAGAPWLRQISSPAYPLTGPYDSRNREILRWQIRQAKAAGIDGFFVCLYTWAPHLAYLSDIFFGTASEKGMLQIASEEHFKLGIEMWGIGEHERTLYADAWREAIAQHLAAIAASPYKDAYITIEGKPAVWLIFPSYLSDRQRMQFLDGTTDQPRSVAWIFRDVRLEDTIDLNQRLVRSKAQFASKYDFPSLDGWNLMPDFMEDLVEVGTRGDLGMVPIAHAYVGYDERWGMLTHPYEGRFGLRSGTSFMTGFLDTAVAGNAKIILMESWNEWGEGSTIEAGLNISRWRDMGQEHDLYLDEQGNDAPYRYLDVLRRFNGMQEWVPPKPPPCSAIDPLMRDFHTTLPETLRCIP